MNCGSDNPGWLMGGILSVLSCHRFLDKAAGFVYPQGHAQVQISLTLWLMLTDFIDMLRLKYLYFSRPRPIRTVTPLLAKPCVSFVNSQTVQKQHLRAKCWLHLE